MNLSPLEQKIFDLLIQEDPEKEILKSQISQVEILERSYSGVGVFTKFKVSESAEKLGKERLKLEDFPGAYLTHPALEAGAGVILWLNSGYLDTLECFTYGGDWPANEQLFTVHT
ncbi:hypothetical protein [Microbulbifer taiwanensis]